MASITSSVGLATGIDIQGTVDQLIQVAAVPRDNLQARTSKLENEQVAITELSAYLYAVQAMIVNLGKEELFNAKTAISSNEAAMVASVDSDNATVGSYTFTTLKTAQNEQWLSQGVVDDEASLGEGEFSFRFGDDLQRGLPLEILNGGDGIERGVIRITDRSGAWADIDLSSVQTLDDVTDAISSNLNINVTAVAHGDGIRLIDDTGRADVNLLVQEVSGSTAASLGLDGINVAASVADGEDLISLFEELDLSQLNDGNGVHMASNVMLGDIDYTLADGTEGTIDFTPTDGESSWEDPPETLEQLIELVNAAEPGKLQVEIDEDGKRLIVTDLTTGGGTLTLTEKTSGEKVISRALEDLGLTGASDEGVITGRRLLGGTGSVLVSTLNGGSTETLGSINVTDRAGTNQVIDLSGAETVEEVLETIEGAGLALTAELNDAKNGIRITDTSGAEISNLIIASEGGPDTSALLGITADTAETVVDSGDLHQQIISYDTLLDDLNGGAGIARGNFTVTGTNNMDTVFHLADPLIRTVGDLIAASSEGDANITLDINPTGDGLIIKADDTGEGTLKVTDSAKGTAASLHLDGEQEIMEIDGEETRVINGSMTHVIELEEGDSLQSLAEKINEIAGGATASILSDGSIRPYRMVLKSDSTGLPASMVIDTSALGLDFQQTVEAQNAAISLGTADSGILLSSTTNSFTGVIEHVTLQVNQASATPVTITIGRDDTDVTASVMAMVNNYNNFRDRYNELTMFNTATGKGEILFGDSTTRRVGDAVNLALTDRYVGVGDFQTLRELGISISSDDGTLTFDEAVLTEKFAEDPESVKQFFTADVTEDDSTGETVEIGAKGFAVAFGERLESLIGQDTSTMAIRFKTLDTQIRDNEDRIDFLTDRLAAQRERLLWDFYYMELAVSKLQSQQTAIDAIQPLDLSAVSKMRG